MGNSTNTDELRALLERLFPDVKISDTAVHLVAVQIAQLENHSLFRYLPNHFQPKNETALHFGTPQPPNRLLKYGTNNYTE